MSDLQDRVQKILDRRYDQYVLLCWLEGKEPKSKEAVTAEVLMQVIVELGKDANTKDS